MKIKNWFCLRASAFFVFFMLVAGYMPGYMQGDVLAATTLSVAESECPVDSCYTSVSAALADAVTGDSIVIYPGTYTEVLTLSVSVSISGDETARTILSGDGSGPIITVSGVSGIDIQKLTFKDASTGIQLTGSSTGININNNVFRTNETAVSVADSTSSAVISNNTFYQNDIGISSASTADVIENNIFFGNETAVSTLGVVQSNCFSSNSDDNSWIDVDGNNGNIDASDPLFTDPDEGDFHMKEGSPCLGTNISDNSDDMGTYGGSEADTIPFPVTILSASAESSTSVSISWEPNLAYNVTNSTNPGSYDVVYTSLASGTTNTITVPAQNADTMTTDISGLTDATDAPEGPVVNTIEFADETLIVSWQTVTDATGYKVHYLDSETSEETTIDVGNTLIHVITDLVNGREYSVSVSAYSEATYTFSVIAKDNVGNESAPSEKETIELGDAAEGPRSESQTESPERIAAGPDLPNEGCFIATAAYGFYSAPQVQILREFRDRYLVTNSPGRAFVEWYYRYGPVGAHFINVHPWLKPVVRAALLPLIGGTWLLMHAGPGIQIMAFLLAVAAPLFLIVRRELLKSGGAR